MIRAQDLFIAAKKYSQSKDEVDLRESIKLSYYYVYHSLFDLLNQQNIHCFAQAAGLHEQLVYRVKSIDTREARKLGDLLKRLKNRRVIACYRLDKTVSLLEVNYHLLECERCVDFAQQLFPNNS